MNNGKNAAVNPSFYFVLLSASLRLRGLCVTKLTAAVMVVLWFSFLAAQSPSKHFNACQLRS